MTDRSASGNQFLRLGHHTIFRPSHVRIALSLLVLIENEERTRQALRGIKQMLAKGVLVG